MTIPTQPTNSNQSLSKSQGSFFDGWCVRKAGGAGVKKSVEREGLSVRSGPATAISGPGCYSLIISLGRAGTARVGKLGEARFPRGHYLYTGSAMGGLEARLKRHLRREKRPHWHIDHLLGLPAARVDRVVVYPAAPGQECRQNRRIAALPGATLVLKRFGATDCKSGCASHLYFFANAPTIDSAGGALLLPRFSTARRGTHWPPKPTLR